MGAEEAAVWAVPATLVGVTLINVGTMTKNLFGKARPIITVHIMRAAFRLGPAGAAHSDRLNAKKQMLSLILQAFTHTILFSAQAQDVS